MGLNYAKPPYPLPSTWGKRWISDGHQVEMDAIELGGYFPMIELWRENQHDSRLPDDGARLRAWFIELRLGPGALYWKRLTR